MKFETKMEKLEKIISELENNEIPLDDAINKYGEAMILIKECNEQLQEIESTVAKMVSDNGDLQDLEIA